MLRPGFLPLHVSQIHLVLCEPAGTVATATSDICLPLEEPSGLPGRLIQVLPAHVHSTTRNGMI